MKLFTKRFRVLISILLIAISVLDVGTVSASPGGYRLPFSGYAEISTGPRCYKHYGVDQEALDFPMSFGRNILASKTGVAFFYPNTWPGGNMVKIYHNDGLVSTYAHLKGFEQTKYWYFAHYATNGVWVNQGDVVGYAGSTGSSTGVHLHFSVNRANGSAVVIYDMPGMHWWIPNVATRWNCTIDGRNEGWALG